MKKLNTVLVACFVLISTSSCTTTVDNGTMAILNQRLDKIEHDIKETEEELKITSDKTLDQMESSFIELRQTGVNIWIKLSNQADYPVKFELLDDGRYKGPKGEYYTKEPTREQVETLYKF